MDLPIYNLQISEAENDGAEVSFIALVDQPAIKRDFLAFKDAVKFEVVSEDQHIITGPLMVPDQLIYRNSDKFGEHYVKFSADTIKQIAIKFSKKGYQKNVNLMHDAKMQVEGFTMFESFISDEKRGVKPMAAFSDLPNGTWFGTFYVENNEVWGMIKMQQVKGFSVEGLFDYEKPQSKEETALNELKRIFDLVQN
jgi:hypothetical protein